jgi:hypothetical protein
MSAAEESPAKVDHRAMLEELGSDGAAWGTLACEKQEKQMGFGEGKTPLSLGFA